MGLHAALAWGSMRLGLRVPTVGRGRVGTAGRGMGRGAGHGAETTRMARRRPAALAHTA
ncbi:hypothetical protein GCM10017688_12710 [Streptomyces ramulosus]